MRGFSHTCFAGSGDLFSVCAFVSQHRAGSVIHIESKVTGLQHAAVLCLTQENFVRGFVDGQFTKGVVGGLEVIAEGVSVGSFTRAGVEPHAPVVVPLFLNHIEGENAVLNGIDMGQLSNHAPFELLVDVGSIEFDFVASETSGQIGASGNELRGFVFCAGGVHEPHRQKANEDQASDSGADDGPLFFCQFFHCGCLAVDRLYYGVCSFSGGGVAGLLGAPVYFASRCLATCG